MMQSRCMVRPTIGIKLLAAALFVTWLHILYGNILATVYVDKFPEVHDERMFHKTLEPSKDSFIKSYTPQDLSDWLQNNRDTPGGKLIDLLGQYLHVEPGAEATRREGCHKKQNLPVCYGGFSYNDDSCINDTDDEFEKEKCAKIPIWNHHDKLPFNAFRMQRLSGPGSFLQDRFLLALGTQTVCLPLILAGAALGDQGVAVELGTFVGFSSRCLGLGLNSTGNENIYYGFDSFDGVKNYKKITGMSRWVRKYNPDYTIENNSFLFLWNLVMNDVYPTGKAIAAFIDESTLNPSVLDEKPIAVISIDSAKDHAQLMKQLGGIMELKKGTIFVSMDFTYVSSIVKASYACYRPFLFPVYSSFCKGEHTIFVVMETFNLKDVFNTCMSELGKDMDGNLPSKANLDAMRHQIEIDARFLNRLFLNDAQTDAVDDQEQCLIDAWQRSLVNNARDWNDLVRSSGSENTDDSDKTKE